MDFKDFKRKGKGVYQIINQSKSRRQEEVKQRDKESDDEDTKTTRTNTQLKRKKNRNGNPTKIPRKQTNKKTTTEQILQQQKGNF